ncbi:MAG: TIGR00269 family protein [Nanobdellota archaeon]
MRSKKQFMELVEKKIRNTIRKNKLFKKKDKLAIALSGGKDSMSCLYILSKLGYNPVAIMADHGIGKYAQINYENAKNLCESLKIELKVFSFKDEFGKSLKSTEKIISGKGYNYSYCMICGILKRYLLNKASREMGIDVLITGHNLDDEAQAFVMNVFRNDFKLAARQGPAPGLVSNTGFVKRVKPLFFLAESDLKTYSEYAGLCVTDLKCPYATSSYRHDFKGMLNDFEKRNPSVKYNIAHFQQMMKSYMDFSKIKNIGNCELCGEPSSRKICKACEIVGLLQK